MALSMCSWVTTLAMSLVGQYCSARRLRDAAVRVDRRAPGAAAAAGGPVAGSAAPDVPAGKRGEHDDEGDRERVAKGHALVQAQRTCRTRKPQVFAARRHPSDPAGASGSIAPTLRTIARAGAHLPSALRAHFVQPDRENIGGMARDRVGDAELREALDCLYAAPLEGFVAARRAVAAELKARGDVAGAQTVAAAAKPTRTAWALNQVARRHPERVRAMLEARDEAAAAQAGAKADELRDATREYRAHVADLVREVRGVLDAAGAQASAAQLRHVSETIQAASAADSDMRAQLAEGRLVKDVELDDPFGGFAAAPSLPHAKPAKRADAGVERASERKRVEDEQRAAEREKARRQLARERAARLVAELEEKAREARAAARHAETAAARAGDEARRARRAADEVQVRLDKAREEERKLRGA